jgi:hypothetical protein
MKKQYVLLALMLVGPPVAYAQTTAAKPGAAAAGAGEGNVEQALTKIEHDSLAALLKKDAAGFGKYLADDAVLTGPDGMVQTKAELLADVKSGALTLESSDVSDMKVHVHGDAAVVTYGSVAGRIFLFVVGARGRSWPVRERPFRNQKSRTNQCGSQWRLRPAFRESAS